MLQLSGPNMTLPSDWKAKKQNILTDLIFICTIPFFLPFLSYYCWTEGEQNQRIKTKKLNWWRGKKKLT